MYSLIYPSINLFIYLPIRVCIHHEFIHLSIQICDALRDLVVFALFKKRGKHPGGSVNFNGCFSHFLNCTNATESHNAPNLSKSIHQSTQQPIHPCFHACIHPSIHLYIYVFIHPSTHQLRPVIRVGRSILS